MLTDVQGSGWNIEKFLKMDLFIAAYDSILGSSYIRTPDSIANKHAIVNVKNDGDDFCFLYSVLAQIYPCKNNRHQTYNYQEHIENKTLNCTGLKFPLPLNKISLFESLNPTIGVSVLYVDDDESTFFPVRVTEFRNRLHHINLLLLHDPLTGKSHYTLITSLSALLNSKSKHRNKCFPCPFCLHHFSLERLLVAHSIDCGKHKPLVIRFSSPFLSKFQEGEPIEGVEDLVGIMDGDAAGVFELMGEEEGEEDDEEPRDPPNILKFKNTIHQFPVPFAIYADFELFIVRNGETTMNQAGSVV